MTTAQVFGIEVSQQDITDGVKAYAGKCPVALAVTRALAPFLPFDEVKVIESVYFSYLIKSGDTDKWIRVANLPTKIREWISDFDNGKPVKPIRFSIEVFPPTENELDASNAFLFNRDITPSFNIDTTVL